jgi:hypothetical protein
MPIVLALALLGALIYGALWSYDFLLSHFGLATALSAAALALLLLAALTAWLVRRHRDVAPNAATGPWTHVLERDWGVLQLNAPHRLIKVTLHGQSGEYIFADLVAVAVQSGQDGWAVALEVRDRDHAHWRLPMRERREAQRWARVIRLAMAQRL